MRYDCPVSVFLKMTVCYWRAMYSLTNYAVVIVRAKVSLCIVKNPKDGDFHTSGDSTTEFSSIYYFPKKRCPKVYEGGM